MSSDKSRFSFPVEIFPVRGFSFVLVLPMEEIAKRREKLKLTEHEAEQVVLEEEEVNEGWVLAGKFLSKRRINLEAVVKALKPIWKTKENFRGAGHP